jgi:FlaA1/EpsC-like NDP-sugar epimerase
MPAGKRLPPRAAYRFHAARVRASSIDIAIILLVYYGFFDFRHAVTAGSLADWHPWTREFALFVCAAVALHVGLNYLVGNYTIVNRYVGLNQAVRLVKAGAAAIGLLLVLVVAWSMIGDHIGYLVPRSLPLVGGLLVLAAMVALRFGEREIYETAHRSKNARQRVLLIGAGDAAQMLIRDVQRNPSTDLKVVGLLDDNPSLVRMSIDGVKVLGPVDQVVPIAEERRISEIIIAIPSATSQQVSRIYRLCRPTGLTIKTLPHLSELVSKHSVSMQQARDLQMVDLLSRPAVTTDRLAVANYIHGRTVLVTGAGGSIGSELCYQIAQCRPGNLVLVDHDESALFELHERLKTLGFSRYVIEPWSILQRSKIESLFESDRPDLVFHAAAYKHVPLMELAPDQAVLNNVEGTRVISELAGLYDCDRFVYISTDKAVEPVSVMGATKRAGELLMSKMSRAFPNTLFATVRFGNVLGSQGSVIPTFKRQIENGGPVVITHPDMKRFFMLIEEAVQLVLQAAVLCGEQVCSDVLRNLNTFVLEMGQPVSIVDVAQKMLDFYWTDPSKSIAVEFCGLRPGEKLDETLTWARERVTETSHPLIKRVCMEGGDDVFEREMNLFEQRLPRLLGVAADHSDDATVIDALQSCVPGFTRRSPDGRPKTHVIVHEPRSPIAIARTR